MIEELSEYSIYACNNLRTIGRPTVITTLDTLNLPNMVCEVFVILEGSKTKLLQFTFSYKLAKEGDEITVFDTDLIKKEVFSRAEQVLSDHIYDYYEKYRCDIVPTESYSLEKSDEKELLRLWVLGSFNNEIEAVKNSTNCLELKKLLSTFLKYPQMEITTGTM